MKKFIKNNLLGFILGGIIFGSIGVGATVLYNSSEIGFTPTDTNWNVNNLEDAINDLYTNSGARIVKLNGDVSVLSNASHTYDVSNIPGYENFTADNFFYSFVTFRWVGLGSANEADTITYDSSTGTVTFPKKIGGSANYQLDIEYYPILVY